MMTKDDRRWPLGLLNTPARIGKLPDYHRFDASFFAVHGQQAEVSASDTVQAQRSFVCNAHAIFLVTPKPVSCVVQCRNWTPKSKSCWRCPMRHWFMLG